MIGFVFTPEYSINVFVYQCQGFIDNSVNMLDAMLPRIRVWLPSWNDGVVQWALVLVDSFVWRYQVKETVGARL